jgi:hypothetical protein
MFFNAVDKQLLLLIDQLAVCPEVAESFYLTGGTGLALQLGHRTSIDINLFSQSPFDAERYAALIIRLGGRVIQSEEGSVHGVAADVKVSFLYYPYIEKPRRLFSEAERLRTGCDQADYSRFGP